MKIKSFYTTSPIFEGGRFDECKPICVFAAPTVFLHMMRCLLDGESDDTPIDESKEWTFVSRVNFEIDGEDIMKNGEIVNQAVGALPKARILALLEG